MRCGHDRAPMRDRPGRWVRLKASNLPTEKTTIANWQPLLLRRNDFVSCPDLFRHGAGGTGRRIHDPERTQLPWQVTLYRIGARTVGDASPGIRR